MGLEIRGQKKYFYRSRRMNGRVVKEYLGSGERAESNARQDAEFRVLRKQIEKYARTLDEIERLNNLFIEAWMLAAGYHKPNRGPWRKRRIPKSSEPPKAPAE
jgi:hypothetical protein